MIPRWAGGYVGLQWKALGRDRDGIDCWGLCRLIASDRFGWGWPDYTEAYSGKKMANSEDGLAAAYAEGLWEKLDNKEDDLNTRASGVAAGDVVHLKHAEHLVHVGLMLDSRHFIHVAMDQTSVITRVDDMIWRHRIEGFFRWTKR
jgi:cell wall-associated NlpC family hydrolase